LYFPFLSYIIKKRFIFSLRGKRPALVTGRFFFCFLLLPRLLARSGRMPAHVIWLFLAHPKPKDSTTIFWETFIRISVAHIPAFPPFWLDGR